MQEGGKNISGHWRVLDMMAVGGGGKVNWISSEEKKEEALPRSSAHADRRSSRCSVVRRDRHMRGKRKIKCLISNSQPKKKKRD